MGFNPVGAIKSGLSAISLAGKALGKAQKLYAAVAADVDQDGTPEYQEALNGLQALWRKLVQDTIPKAKQHFAEYKEILVVQVIPNVQAVFKAAKDAAAAE